MEPCYPLNKAKNIKNNGNNHINTTTNLGFDRSIDSGIRNIEAHIHAHRYIYTQSYMYVRAHNSEKYISKTDAYTMNTRRLKLKRQTHQKKCMQIAFKLPHI